VKETVAVVRKGRKDHIRQMHRRQDLSKHKRASQRNMNGMTADDRLID
jgi:hypothetical protein